MKAKITIPTSELAYQFGKRLKYSEIFVPVKYKQGCYLLDIAKCDLFGEQLNDALHYVIDNQDAIRSQFAV